MFEDIVIPKDILPLDGRFGSGPTKVPLHFLDKLRESGTSILGNSHRNNNILNLVENCQQKLKKYFSLPDDWEVLLGNGGASFIWEILAYSVINKKSAHFACGEFSNKWHSLTAKAPWLSTELFEAPFASLPDLVYDGDADLIGITHNETSTGVMIPACPDFTANKEALVAVDATSIAGVCHWDWQKTDIYYFSLQKAFGGEGGLYIALASPRFIERVEAINKTERYIPTSLSMATVVSNSIKHQTYNTPSLSTLFFLNCALDDFLKQGLNNIEKQTKEKADFLYNYAENSSYLMPYIKEPHIRSISVATIDVDDSIRAEDLVKVLRQNGIVDINSYRKLGRNQIRVGLFPFINKEDLMQLTKCLDYLFNTL